MKTQFTACRSKGWKHSLQHAGERMETKHSLQHAGAKDKNITQVKMHSHFCLIVSHMEHVHYMCMCGPEPPPAKCQECHKLHASDCMSRFQKKPTFLNKGFIAAQEPRDGLFSLLHFCFSLCLLLLLLLLQHEVPDGPGLTRSGQLCRLQFMCGP